MDELESLLKKRNRELQNYKEISDQYLAQSVEGSLESSMTRDIPRFYIRKNKRKKYLSKQEWDLVTALAQKGYFSDLSKAVKKEQRALEKYLSRYDPNSILDVFENLSPERRNLVQPVIPDDQTFIEQWYQEHRKHTNPYPLDGKYYTDRGEQVRSKTEILIANAYNLRGIPYVYEGGLQLKNGKFVYPDFATLNVRTRKTYYHEHHGMMDDPEYSIRAIEKIQLYEKNGYIQGENIYHTFETKDLPYNIQQLHQFIDLKLR